MRLFLAQSAVLNDYTALQTRFSPCVQGRWRMETSLHATVLFLGERYDVSQAVETVSSLAYSLQNAPIIGVGLFEHNRIFYAAAEHPTLIETHAKLSGAFGMAPHRSYIPHVTLMRCKTIDTGCFESAQTAFAKIKIGSISGPLTLMKSTLTPLGAVYEPLYQF
jgi:2'-5' RNA ligase